MTPRARCTFLDSAARGAVATVAALALTALVHTAAAAQGAGAVFLLDPSVRAAGAGGASNAAFWGGDPNYWANPALLGYHRGLRFEWGRTKLAPDFAPGVQFESKRLSLNVGGVGIAVAGVPDDFGGLELDYGPVVLPSQGPTPFAVRDRIESWSVGLSLAEMAHAAARQSGDPVPEALRRFDVAAGMTRKEARLGGNLFEAPAETGGADWGVLVRLTPVNTFENARRRDAPSGVRHRSWRRLRDRDRVEREARIESRRTPTRLDLAYGFSVINADDGSVPRSDGSLEPLSRMIRHGVSAHVASGRADRFVDSPWIARGLTPVLALGFTADHEHVQPGDFADPSYDVRRFGAELTVMNVLSLRAGYVKDDEGDIEDTTLGVGVGYDFGRIAGVRFDWAEVPRAAGLEKIERKGFTAYVDAVALLQAASRGSWIASTSGGTASGRLAPAP
jgi:hypothetical protein